MNSSRVVRAMVLVLLLSPTLFAAEDLTGKWDGSFIISADGNPPMTDKAHMVAKQDKGVLTGTIGPDENEQYEILKGKIETVKEGGKDVTKVSFDVVAGASGPLAHATLTLVDGHLKGTLLAEQEGHKMTATMDLTRIK
jgi:hypothetical protein